MKLTNEQVLQIDNYVSNSGIKYYDVKNEIIDHFATILEQKLAENPKLDFKQEIANIQDSFSATGTSHLMAISGLHIVILTGIIYTFF